MPSTSRPNQYLESKVLTASQPQLHLMLLEGALRFGRQARQMWGDQSQVLEIDRLLNKTIDLVEALVSGVVGQKTEISEQLEELYAFLFRELVACRYNLASEIDEKQRLDGVLELLEYQRKTWKQACALCESGDSASANVASAPTRAAAPGAVRAPLSASKPLTMLGNATSEGFSLEA